MSKQFTKLFTQTHYYGYSSADNHDYTCATGGSGDHCVRDFSQISEYDTSYYGIKAKTRSSHDSCGNCAKGSDKVQCATSSHPTESITWDHEETCSNWCPEQKRCSIPNAHDCSAFGVNYATGAVQNSREPGGSNDQYDRTIKCTYKMNSGGASDFSNTATVQAYLDKYHEDDVWKTVIMPYFCSFKADHPPTWAGKSLPPGDPGYDSAPKICSRFVGDGLGGDAEMCRKWATDSLEDDSQESAVSSVMSAWCNQYKWLPECKCMQKTDKTYGDPYFSDLFLVFGQTSPGCWYMPCSRGTWENHTMLVTPYDIHPEDCGNYCDNFIISINSDQIDYDDVNQNISGCTIDQDDMPYPDDGVDCTTTADPKMCVCDSLTFSSSDKFIQDSINDMPLFKNAANQKLVAEKANQYAKAKCYKNPTFSSAQYDSWLSLPPVLDKVPMFDSKTGAFYGTYESNIPTNDQKARANAIVGRMFSDTQFPCKSQYTVQVDIADPTKTVVITNENYDACVKKQTAKFGVPDPVTNACPYIFDGTDEYGAPQTYPVDPTLRSQCVFARGIDHLPVDGDDPAVDDIDKKYHLTDPINGKCPTTRTYTDDNGEEHTKTMNDDEIAICESSDDFVPDDGGDGGSKVVQGVVIGAVALAGLALLSVGGYMLFKKQK